MYIDTDTQLEYTYDCLRGDHGKCGYMSDKCCCKCHSEKICGNIVGYRNETILRCCRVKGHKEDCCEWRADGVSRMDAQQCGYSWKAHGTTFICSMTKTHE